MAQAPVRRITAKPKKSEPIDILGVTYQVKPPKTSLLLLISEHSASKGTKKDGGLEPGVIANDFDNILKLMFGKQFDAVKKHLSDPLDELDLDHIFEAVEMVTEDDGDPSS